MNRAIFLDRDGVINVDDGFVCRQEDFEFIDGVFDALQQWSAAGYLLIVVTNQSGIGRGYYTESDFEILNDWMLAQLRNESVAITQVYHCSHAPETECDCRKPAPGMILQACRDHDIDPAESLMVGDKLSDMQAGRSAGVANLIMVRSGQFTASRIDADDVTIEENLLATCKLISAEQI